jgi:large subunit ribosomal protein L15
MPLQRRLPKRGFTNIFRKEYAIVHVKDLNRFESGSVVDLAALMSAGLVRKVMDGVKLLSDGEVDRPLLVKVDKASRAAVKKVTAAGGTLEVSSPC